MGTKRSLVTNWNKTWTLKKNICKIQNTYQSKSVTLAVKRNISVFNKLKYLAKQNKWEWNEKKGKYDGVFFSQISMVHTN